MHIRTSSSKTRAYSFSYFLAIILIILDDSSYISKAFSLILLSIFSFSLTLLSLLYILKKLKVKDEPIAIGHVHKGIPVDGEWGDPELKKIIRDLGGTFIGQQ